MKIEEDTIWFGTGFLTGALTGAVTFGSWLVYILILKEE